MGDREGEETRYRAFLSYSHKDAAAAGRLHRRLEAYRIPRRLVGRETARGPVPARLWPIFRDREELPAATDLSETVREALAQSGALIILCSPDAAGSLWVAEEIRVFRELHPERPILAAILEGNPPGCFPELLRAMGDGHEPLGADLRRERDGERLGLLKLVAGITGLGLDDLVQRDASRRVRRVMAVTAGAVAAMLVMAVLVVMAMSARREAERQRAEAEGLVEFMLTELRTRLRGVGSLEIMDSVNRRALSYYAAQGDPSGLSADSLDRRARALLAMGEDQQFRHRYVEAGESFREAHRITAELLGRDPDNPDRLYTHAQSEYWVGTIDYYRRNYASARRAWQNYRELADHLLAIDAGNPRSLREVAYADGNLCTLARERHEDRNRTLVLCQSSLTHMQQVYAREPGNLERALDVANRQGYVADCWRALGRRDEERALRDSQQSLAHMLITRAPNNRDYQDFWMRTQSTYGLMLLADGERAEARPWLEGAAATARMLSERDPANATWRRWRRDTAARLAQLSNGRSNVN
jgi:hypothetical protein